MIRREFLVSRRSFLIGCSLAASPLLTPISFAAAPGNRRLVVILLRGAMDGLDVLRPLGDPDYAALRPKLLRGVPGQPEAVDLDGFFALHGACADLAPLWQAGELGFAHAVATPYRDKRSHFVGQALLENGGPAADGTLASYDGWLNRALACLPGADSQTAVSIGREHMLILQGEARYSQYMPVQVNRFSAQGEALLGRLYDQDPELSDIFDQALDLRQEAAETARQAAEMAETDDEPDMATEREDGTEAAMAMTPAAPEPRKPAGKGKKEEAPPLGRYVATRLNEEARIATFSLPGWDTHQNQARLLPGRLKDLSGTLLEMKAGLGRNWDNTLVLAITEFGRTARENGSGGTDHGTGGAMLLAGGALKGRRVLGDWPGLDQADLYQQRDLRPTRDVRAYAGWALRDMFGLSTTDLERTVFPDLDLGGTPGLLL